MDLAIHRMKRVVSSMLPNGELAVKVNMMLEEASNTYKEVIGNVNLTGWWPSWMLLRKPPLSETQYRRNELILQLSCMQRLENSLIDFRAEVGGKIKNLKEASLVAFNESDWKLRRKLSRQLDRLREAELAFGELFKILYGYFDEAQDELETSRINDAKLRNI